jgi:hypothetical protein
MIVLFLLPRLSPNVGGAVDASGRGEGARGGGVAARGRSGVLIGRSMMVVVPPCDSPAIW